MTFLEDDLLVLSSICDPAIRCMPPGMSAHARTMETRGLLRCEEPNGPKSRRWIVTDQGVAFLRRHREPVALSGRDPLALYDGPLGIEFHGSGAREWRDAWISLIEGARMDGTEVRRALPHGVPGSEDRTARVLAVLGAVWFVGSLAYIVWRALP